MLAATPIIFLVTFAAKGPGFQEMEACSLLVNLRKGMQRSSERPLVGEERYVTTLITAVKETSVTEEEFFASLILVLVLIKHVLRCFMPFGHSIKHRHVLT